MDPQSSLSILEALEPRLAPAGVAAGNVVNFTTTGGTLTIVGSADAEHITIADNPATGEWIISYEALSPQTIFKLNGVTQADPSFHIAVPASIKATMGAGADQIDFVPTNSGMIIAGTVSLIMEKGDDVVNLGSAASQTLIMKGAVSIDLGDGADQVEMTSKALFANTVSIKGGAQNDIITFLDGGTIHTFQKGLAVDLGTGADEFTIHSDLFRVFGGPLSIKGGGEGGATQLVKLQPVQGWVDTAATIAFGAGNVGVAIGYHTTDDFHFGAGLSVTTGSGSDAIFFNGNVVIAGAFVADLKDGANYTTIVQSAFVKAGSINLKGGVDYDQFDLEKDCALIVNGALNLSLGGGLNETLATSDKGGQFLSAGSINISGTTGNESFRFEGKSITVLGDTVFNLGAGKNRVFITAASSAYFGGNFTATGMTGDDTVGFSTPTVTVMGNINLNLGSGTNIVGIGGVVTPEGDIGDGGYVDIVGNVSITGGMDDDFVEILGASVRIGRALQFAAGDAAVYNHLTVSADYSVFGSISYTGGKGEDRISLGESAADTNVMGDAVLTLGAGFSKVFSNHVAYHGALKITSTGLADQSDRVDIYNNIVFGAVTLNLGAGSSLTTINDAIFCDAFTANLGAGTDVMKLDNEAPSGAVTGWYGLVKINLGAGDDTLNIGGTGAEDVGNFFSKAVTIDGGAGTDSLTDDHNTYLTGGAPTKISIP